MIDVKSECVRKRDGYKINRSFTPMCFVVGMPTTWCKYFKCKCRNRRMHICLTHTTTRSEATITKNTRYSLANSSIKTNCYSVEGSAIKYIVRHQDKGGKESLEKSETFYRYDNRKGLQLRNTTATTIHTRDRVGATRQITRFI